MFKFDVALGNALQNQQAVRVSAAETVLRAAETALAGIMPRRVVVNDDVKGIKALEVRFGIPSTEYEVYGFISVQEPPPGGVPKHVRADMVVIGSHGVKQFGMSDIDPNGFWLHGAAIMRKAVDIAEAQRFAWVDPQQLALQPPQQPQPQQQQAQQPQAQQQPPQQPQQPQQNKKRAQNQRPLQTQPHPNSQPANGQLNVNIGQGIFAQAMAQAGVHPLNGNGHQP